MAQIRTESARISVSDAELSGVQEVEHFMREVAQTHATPKLVGTDGSTVDLPPSIRDLLHRAVQLLAQGQAVSVVPVEQELTTQQAADLLNVSRPYFIKVLEQGNIPHTKTGTHRRVRAADVLLYRARRDAQRTEALAQLAQLSQEIGLYDD